MARATGREITEFYKVGWTTVLDDAWYYGDCGGLNIEDDDGRPCLTADRSYDSSDFGPVMWQGDGEPYLPGGGPCETNTLDLVELALEWAARQTHVTVSVRVPRGEEQDVRTLCVGRGWIVT